MQKQKNWILLGYVVVAAITWVFFYNLTDLVWDLAKLPVPMDWFVTPAQIIAFVAAIVMFFVLQKDQRINQFSSEVASELSKVTWPEKRETILSTGVIAVMVAVCAMILFGFDSLWGTVVQWIY